VGSDKVEFKMLEAKLVGSDTVVFRLEDGAQVKIKVDIARAGVATNLTNPDGTPHYNINADLRVRVSPPKKEYSIPRSKIKFPTAKKESTIRPV